MRLKEGKEREMKGIKQQLDEMKSSHIEYSEMTLLDLEKMLQMVMTEQEKERIARTKAKKENRRFLQKRSKELGKPIPDELYIKLVMMYPPYVSSDFVEKYEEWLNDEPKKPELPSNTDLILQHAMRNFPVNR